MKSFLIPLGIVLLCLFQFTQALSTFSIDLPAQEEACFLEELASQEQLDIAFEAYDSDNLEIDFYINAPNGDIVYRLFKQPSMSYSFYATNAGIYQYCFSNKFNGDDKKLHFSIHGPNERTMVLSKTSDSEEAADQIVDPIEKAIERLASSLRFIRDEQAYMYIRDRVHNKTANSTNRRVSLWSIFETIMLICVSIWQIYYLRSWFSVTRT